MVTHELGHAIGLDHDEAGDGGLMEPALGTGVRRLPSAPVDVGGTTGTMSLQGASATGQVRLVQGKGAEPRLVEGAPLPEGRDTLAKEFIHHLETGEPLHTTLDADFNLDAMAVLDAGIRSAESGKMELVNNFYWTAG